MLIVMNSLLTSDILFPKNEINGNNANYMKHMNEDGSGRLWHARRKLLVAETSALKTASTMKQMDFSSEVSIWSQNC